MVPSIPQSIGKELFSVVSVKMEENGRDIFQVIISLDFSVDDNLGRRAGTGCHERAQNEQRINRFHVYLFAEKSIFNTISLRSTSFSSFI